MKDLTGKRFGKLKVTGFLGTRDCGSKGRGQRKKRSFWSVSCDCGNTAEMGSEALVSLGIEHCPVCTLNGHLATPVTVGSRFGTLTARKSLSEPSQRWMSSRKWELVCDCGQVMNFQAAVLVRGKAICRACRVGETPEPRGELTPVSFIGKRGGKDFWLWGCSCGGQKEFAKTTRRKDCGCSIRKAVLVRDPDAAIKAIYKQYRKGAKRRKIVFSLGLEEFTKLIQSPCHYTGVAPSREYKTRHGSFFWNGIDRVSSAGGYTSGNVVPCETSANIAKGTKSYDEFTEWLDTVAAFWANKPSAAKFRLDKQNEVVIDSSNG